MKLLTCGFLCLFLTTTNAKLFTNAYMEFRLPAQWECYLEGTEWVCQSKKKNRKKEAIIILAAKIRGNDDGRAEYQSYLKKPKTFILPGGRTQVSEPKYVKNSKINDHLWIDGLHLASEVPGFYTRYMVTVKSDLGVAVTFSTSKDHYIDYLPVMDKVISTLRVFDPKPTKNLKTTELVGLGKSSKGIDLENMVVDFDSNSLKSKSKVIESESYFKEMVLMLVLLVFAYLSITKKKGRKSKKKIK